MSWQDRQYRDPEPDTAWRRALRRVFTDPNNFFSWSIPLFRFSGIAVRVHIFYLIYIITTLMWSVTDRVGFTYSAISMAVLFVLVLLHEFGHCFACRWVGGEANEIVMWPLGGLAMCHPPRTWKASFITTAGGPMVNVVLIPVIALLLWAIGAPGHAFIFNPFKPGDVLATAWFNANYLGVAMWWAYYVNFTLLAFNVLLPMFPLDGGRLLQELLWARNGYRRSMLQATFIGLVGAVALGLFALTARGQASNVASSNLLGIAIFAGITCFSERRRVQMMDEIDYGYEHALQEQQEIRRQEADERAARRKQRDAVQTDEASQQTEVDRILTKIREQGMASLTKREQATLRGETERKRKAL